MTIPAVSTDFPLPPDVEGFWSWEKGHFPRPATPLTQELLYRALTDGFSRAMEDWACPFGVECRAINYYAFLALRPFDLGAETVEDRSARYQQILGEVLPRMGDLWMQEWLPAILPGLEKGRTADYTALSNAELLHRLDEMLRDFRARWTIHGYVNFVVISASWFADFYNETFEPEDPPSRICCSRASPRALWTPAAACGGSAAASKRAPHSRGYLKSRSQRSWSRTWSARTRGATS